MTTNQPQRTGGMIGLDVVILALMLGVIVTFAIQALLEPAWRPGVHEHIAFATYVMAGALLATLVPLLAWRCHFEIKRNRLGSSSSHF
jgi:Mg/Co/Ni transporter MgtE